MLIKLNYVPGDGIKRGVMYPEIRNGTKVARDLRRTSYDWKAKGPVRIIARRRAYYFIFWRWIRRDRSNSSEK